ncbi:hypothetical protein [Pseudomonas moorei]|uniref:hypothetical protein n=1 Tax=Pseudomonas moorei TaxID=395599 RepID=UPI001FF396AE|nr:hypothetical protein [Pseudomonas moorei]
MQAVSGQEEVKFEYRGHDVTLFLAGPHNLDADEGFDVTIDISKGLEEVRSRWRESSITHKLREDAVRVGTSVARNEIYGLFSPSI